MFSRTNTGLAARLGTLTATGLIVSALLATVASAAPDPVKGHPYRRGIVPDNIGNHRGAAPSPYNLGNASADTKSRHTRHGATASSSGTNLSYGGGVSVGTGVDPIGVTTGAPKVYLIFWGTQWGTPSGSGNNLSFSADTKGLAPRVEAFMQGLGTINEQWSGVMTQYCQAAGMAKGSQTCPSNAEHVGYSTGGALKGVWFDGSTSSPNTATGKQLATEALSAAAHFNDHSRDAQYVIVSPSGTNPDNYKYGGFCAWHDYTGDTTLSGGAASASAASSVAFTNLPYLPDAGSSCGANFLHSGSAGTLDGVTIVEGHEYAETVTDEFPAGGWTDSSGSENGDKCAWISPSSAGGVFDLSLATGTFAVQTTWSNDITGCQGSHPIVSSAPSSGTVSFSGMSTNATAGSPVSGTVTLSSPAKTDVIVTLSSTGAGSFTPNTVTIPVNQTSATVSYHDDKAESTTVTPSAPNYTSASQTETVGPAAPSSLLVTPRSATIGIGASQTFVANLTDQYGNAVNAANTTWSVSGPGASMSPTAPSASINFSANTASPNDSVTATNGTFTSSATVAVTASPITDGGFESGLSGWTPGGNNPAPQVGGNPVHGGTHAALLGDAGAGEPNGDSWISQTFTVPAGGGTLSFWTWDSTTDTVRYDWQTCELRNPAGTTLKSLFKVASNAHAWQQQTASLASYAGQSITVWCNVHEDGWGDATYMYLDDFSVQ